MPFWDGTRIWKAPNFSWGNRIVASNDSQAGTAQRQLPGLSQHQHRPRTSSISLTKVKGRHTIKTGFYNNHSLKRENTSQGAAQLRHVNFGNDTVGNPFDTSFGFANAAIGSFTEFSQAVEIRRGHVQRSTTEKPTCRTTGR